MILVWRAMAPMQGMFVFLTRVDQLKNSITQTNRLLALAPERSGGLPLTAPQGHVAFANVTFRYPGEADPAFSNVSFEAKPGEVTAIVGKNGSGKSAILTAIVVCFGASARSTSRAKALKDFIRKTHGGSAHVSVTLQNVGPEAFRPEVYGRQGQSVLGKGVAYW